MCDSCAINSSPRQIAKDSRTKETSSERLGFFMSNLLSGAVQIAMLRFPPAFRSISLAAVLVRSWRNSKSSQAASLGVDPSNMGHGKLVPACAK